MIFSYQVATEFFSFKDNISSSAIFAPATTPTTPSTSYSSSSNTSNSTISIVSTSTPSPIFFISISGGDYVSFAILTIFFVYLPSLVKVIGSPSQQLVVSYLLHKFQANPPLEALSEENQREVMPTVSERAKV